MTIDTMLQGDADAVVVQGRDGVGKTTILNSYVRSRSASSICLFLRAVRASYEPSGVIGELYTQLAVALKARHGATGAASPTRSDLAALVHRVAMRLRSTGQTMVLALDGLADVAAKDRAAAQDILELLPFGRSPFRFLLSGDIDDLLRSAGCLSRSYPVTLFSLDETRQLFSGLGLDDAAVARAHTACNGMVGQLAAVRRLYTSGLSVDEIIEKQPGELAHTMVLEWERAPLLTEKHESVLAVLTFDARRHSLESLANAASLPVSVVTEAVRSATFILEGSGGTLEFISENFRTFAQRRLERLRQATLERLIASMRPTPASDESVTTLPFLMSEAKQFRELTALLDADYFAALVTITESIGAVNVQAAMGAHAAEGTGDEASIYRFRLIQALATDVLRTGQKVAEVAALIAVGQSAEALKIARSAAFREERLRLLSSAVAGLVDRGEAIDAGLRDELRHLCGAAAIDTMADDIVEIAGDVFAADPEAALQLVDRFGSSPHFLIHGGSRFEVAFGPA